MCELVKNIMKDKFFSVTIILQLFCVYFYTMVVSASVQQAFFVNISVPDELNVQTDEIIHMQKDLYMMQDKFKTFITDIENRFDTEFVNYKNDFIHMDEAGIDVDTVYISPNVEMLKDIEIEKGDFFNAQDYEFMEYEEETIPIIVGYELSQKYKLDIGQIITDEYFERQYVIKGILKKGSKWFLKNISEGSILEMDMAVFAPQNEHDFFRTIDYYCIIDSDDSGEIISYMEENAKNNNIRIDVYPVVEELKTTFEDTMDANRMWIVFAIILFVMIFIGTAILFMARINSKQYEIGVKFAVGYDRKKITKELCGQLFIFMIIAYLIALLAGKAALEINKIAWASAKYNDGYYISGRIMILSAIVAIIACLPTVVGIVVKCKKMQIHELTKNKE